VKHRQENRPDHQRSTGKGTGSIEKILFKVRIIIFASNGDPLALELLVLGLKQGGFMEEGRGRADFDRGKNREFTGRLTGNTPGTRPGI
jgi:hypothetical protein